MDHLRLEATQVIQTRLIKGGLVMLDGLSNLHELASKIFHYSTPAALPYATKLEN